VGKKHIIKKAKLVSPFAAGGGGVRFELLVAVYYLIQLMRHEIARGIKDGIVQEVHLQQRNIGNPIDDIIIDCRNGKKQNRLFIQVKHKITFTKNHDFIEVIKQSWNQITSTNFNSECDTVCLAIGEICNNTIVKQHVQDILNWAKTSSNPTNFYKKVTGFKQKLKVYKAFEEAMKDALNQNPTKEELYKLLKHFVIVPFDFDSSSGRDTVNCKNLLLESVEKRNLHHARSLFTILYEMASEYATRAGDITLATLSQRISANATFSVPILQRVGREISVVLNRRIQNRISAERNSKKYIPKVFIEVGVVKDHARLFCLPCLFLKKLANKIINIDLFTINRLMTYSGLKPLKINCNITKIKGTFESVETDTNYLAKRLQTLRTSLLDLKNKNQLSVMTRIPKSKQHIYNENRYIINEIAHSLAEWKIEPLIKEVENARSRVFAIVSRAGQGKTNFMCDFIENCITKHKIPSIFFTGKELGIANKGQLPNYIARSVYGDSAAGSLESLLTDIEEEARLKGTAGLIAIDAINEHPDLQSFSQELEALIEKCMEYPHIRVMFTCRSEYFMARFGNLMNSSFSDRIVVEKEIQEQMESEHRKRLVLGYFKYYKIPYSSISENVFKQLSEDTFLLRVFCEAYGDPMAQSVLLIGRINHIRREALFREYFNRKLQSLKSSATIKTGFLLGTKNLYQKVLREIVEWMLQKRTFSDVPMSIFTQGKLTHLSQLLDEDILIRRDLTSNSILASEEVINFTFDAFRDFLLSDYLLNIVFTQDAQKFHKLLNELTNEQCTVAEGLQVYLFYASRHMSDSQATKTIMKYSWYDEIFLHNVFDLEGDKHTDEDASKLLQKCLSGDSMTPYIACNLIVNFDSERFPHVNINLLFDIFDKMSENDFNDLCVRAFSVACIGYPGGLYSIDKLTKDIRSVIMSKSNRWNPVFTNLARLLLYLWNAKDAYYNHPACVLFDDFSAEHPRIAKHLKEEHIIMKRKGFKELTSINYYQKV
jgi:hypothetical protein